MGIHLRELSDSYPMNTNMTGFRWFSKTFASLNFGKKVASALEGLTKISGDYRGGGHYFVLGTVTQLSPIDSKG